MLNILIILFFKIILINCTTDENVPSISRTFIPPKILPNKTEITVNVNENVKLICEANEPITWKTSKEISNLNSFDSEISEDHIQISHYYNEDNATYTSHLDIFYSNYLDVGYYYCHYNISSPFSNNQHSSDQISSIYIFVNDSDHILLVDNPIVNAYQYRPVVIPCRPTSPDVKITLQKDGDDADNQLSYDPKAGIKISVNSTINAGDYICLATKGSSIEEEAIMLHFLPYRESLPKPIIDDLSDTHFYGHTLSLVCTIQSPGPLSIDWYLPNNRKAKQSSKVTLSKETLVWEKNFGQRNLTISKLSKEDEGMYTCQVHDKGVENSASIFIEIFDANSSYIKLDANNQTVTNVTIGKQMVKWIVNIEAFPPAKTIWYNNKGAKINLNDPKYNITNSKKKSVLRIVEVNLEDAGVYILKVYNDHKMETLNFTLNVLAKPSVKIVSPFEFHYNKENRSSLDCQVVGNPSPDIYWYFKPCAKGDCNSNKISESRYRVKMSKGFYHESILHTVSNISGWFECEACNSVGCEKTSYEFKLTDVPDGFNVWHYYKNSPITVGDEVILTCGATKPFQNELSWYKVNDNLPTKILPNIDFEYHNYETDLSVRLDLKIKKIKRTDAGHFKCSDSDFKYSATLTINVTDPIPPVIVSTNLNNSRILRKLGEPIKLYCMAGGAPHPEITWLKNNKPWAYNPSRIHFSNNNQQVDFLYTQVEDEGQYVCNVENKVGSLARSITIAIKEKYMFQPYYLWSILIAVLIIAILIIFIYFKNKKAKKLKKKLDFIGFNMFDGAIESLNPDLTLDDQIDLLPYDKKFEFSRKKLKLGRQLGSGEFGVVMKAEAMDILEDGVSTTVAVKMVKPNTDYTYIKALVSELKIMIHLGKHLNVVNLLGACTKDVTKQEICVIVEYCRFGNLHNYLLKHRDCFINQINPKNGFIDPTIGIELLSRNQDLAHSESDLPPLLPTASPPVDYRVETLKRNQQSTNVCCSDTVDGGTTTEVVQTSSEPPQNPEWSTTYSSDYKGKLQPICTQDLLCWAFQVARGMEYLASRRVLHGDLAARNILLADNNVVKICDFGLAKSIYKSNDYTIKGECRLPIKWMAIESIRDHIFSTESDVWSFGIVLWEFFSLAKTPYPGMPANEEFFTKLLNGYRMEQPEFATLPIYQTMLNCWDKNPKHRPSFTTLAERLGFMLEDSVREHYVELNSPYVKMNVDRGEDYLAKVSAPNYTNIIASATSSSEYINELNVNKPVTTPLSVDQTSSGYLSMQSSPPSQNKGFKTIFGKNNQRENGKDEENMLEMVPMLKTKVEDQINSDQTDNKASQFPTTNSFSNPSYNVFKNWNQTRNKNGDAEANQEKGMYINVTEKKKNGLLKDKNRVFGLKNVNGDHVETKPLYENAASRDWERPLSKV